MSITRGRFTLPFHPLCPSGGQRHTAVAGLLALLGLLLAGGAPRAEEVRATVEPYVCAGHSAGVTVVRWSPNGKSIASGSSDTSVIVWDASTGLPQATMLGAGISVRRLAWSPDSRTVAANSREKEVVLWDARSGEQRGRLVGHEKSVTSIAWSPGGERIATSSADGSVILWDATSLKVMRRLTPSLMGVGPVNVQWSPDGKHLAAGTPIRGLCIWDAATGEPRVEERGLVSASGVIAWSPDSRTVAYATSQASVLLHDLATGEARATLPFPRDAGVSALSWAPDAEAIAVATAEGQAGAVTIWSAATGRLTATLPVPQSAPPWTTMRRPVSLAWHRGGRLLAGGFSSGTLALWDVPEQKLASDRTPMDGPVHDMAWSPGGRQLAAGVGTPDNTLTVWDVEAVGTVRVERRHRLGGLLQPVREVSWSGDGKSLAIRRMDFAERGLLIWDPHSGTVRAQIEGHPRAMQAASWRPDGRVLATGGHPSVLLWNTAGERLAELPQEVTVYSVAWSPDGNHLASGGTDGAVQLWDGRNLERRTPLATLRGHTQSVEVAAWSPDGQFLATVDRAHTGVGGERNHLVVWEVARRKELARFSHPVVGRMRVAWSPDSTVLAFGGLHRDQPVTLHDSRTLRPVRTLRVPAGGVEVLAWSPDGKSLATGGSHEDRTVVLWDASTGAKRATLSGNTGAVAALAWMPNGRTLASGAAELSSAFFRDDHVERTPDCSAHLWDAAGSPVATLRGHSGNVGALAWRPDGKVLVTGSDDGTLVYWSPAGRLLARSYALREGKDWITITAEGYFAASPGALAVLQWREGDRLRPVEAHRQRFERPDLVRRALSGD